jgi:hypothetical protein
LGTDHIGHILTEIIVCMQPRRESGVRDFFKMAEDALLAPCREIVFEILASQAWLES